MGQSKNSTEIDGLRNNSQPLYCLVTYVYEGRVIRNVEIEGWLIDKGEGELRVQPSLEYDADLIHFDFHKSNVLSIRPSIPPHLKDEK